MKIDKSPSDHLPEKSEFLAAFETYKDFVSQPTIMKMKEKVKKIAVQRGLTSLMNDVKWLKLQQAIPTLAFPPAYLVQLLTDQKEDNFPKDFVEEPNYHGNWAPAYEEGMPPFINIEWMKGGLCLGSTLVGWWQMRSGTRPINLFSSLNASIFPTKGRETPLQFMGINKGRLPSTFKIGNL